MNYEWNWMKRCPLPEDALRKPEDGFSITTVIEQEITVLKSLYDDISVSYMVTDALPEEGYEILVNEDTIDILGGSFAGILYGVFDAERQFLLTGSVTAVSESPACPLRMLNHWDNIDGTIERGYSGLSFFFENDEILVNERTVAYARLCASIGINAVVINNVNVRGNATKLVTDRYLPKLRDMSDIFNAYGIRLYLSINFAEPMEYGLETADPLCEDVREFWNGLIAHLYERIPNFGGVLVKADSEGRPGPFTYGRTHADGANMLAAALEPYGGTVIWRCFVYNCSQDWRDTETDRAKAGYDNFAALDGSFADNVILQVKNGPMDFQVREPVSPLFGAMKQTHLMLEVQAAQEYTGQQKHVCYLLPMWKEVLKFHTHAYEERDRVSEIVRGTHFPSGKCGMAAVANTGNDENWTGSDLAAANWYGFGRIAWNPSLSSEEIALEWSGLQFGMDANVRTVLTKILMSSYETYEKYTVPLGIGWMCNPSYHYGPNVEGYEYDRWGTYHRASCKAIGVDRTSSGTGYTLQYPEELANLYEVPETTPTELLLFFHRLPYTYRLPNGKTLIQHIYDTHFEGVEEVMEMIESIVSIQGMIPEKEYTRIMERFSMQLISAKEWRDRINTYFCRISGIGDRHRRPIYAVDERDITVPDEDEPEFGTENL